MDDATLGDIQIDSHSMQMEEKEYHTVSTKDLISPPIQIDQIHPATLPSPTSPVTHTTPKMRLAKARAYGTCLHHLVKLITQCKILPHGSIP